MELDNSFTVEAPLDRVWSALLDVEQVARCVPGAQVLNQLGEDAYQVGLKVKLGPVTMQYRGQIEVLERDESAHRAVLHGKGKETRGQGTADATVELRLTADDGVTRGDVHADVKVSGRAAAMGQGVMADVAEQLVAQFSDNLSAHLTGGLLTDETPDVPEMSGANVVEAVEVATAGSASEGVERPPEEATPGTAPVEQVYGDPAMTGGQVVTGPGTPGQPRPEAPSVAVPQAPVGGAAQSMPGGRVSDRIAASAERPSAASFEPEDDDSAGLDGLALARTIVLGRLRDPRALLATLLTVAVVAYRLGRSRRRGRDRYSVNDLERLAKLFARVRA